MTSLRQAAIERQANAEAADATPEQELLKAFPGYAQMRTAHLTLEAWTIEKGPLTRALKLKRPELTKHFAAAIEELYANH